MASLAACAFSNQKTQVEWRVWPHMHSRTKPLARFPPNNRSRERLFGRRVETGPFRSFTCGPTRQKRCISWFESAYARVFAASGAWGQGGCNGNRGRGTAMGMRAEERAPRVAGDAGMRWASGQAADVRTRGPQPQPWADRRPPGARQRSARRATPAGWAANRTRKRSGSRLAHRTSPKGEPMQGSSRPCHGRPPR